MNLELGVRGVFHRRNRNLKVLSSFACCVHYWYMFIQYVLSRNSWSNSLNEIITYGSNIEQEAWEQTFNGGKYVSSKDAHGVATASLYKSEKITGLGSCVHVY